MKIKRIEIVGFKSFVDKVALDFEEGVTAVLGPNGCGKSNIVDAIRWVMGEQNAKHLRGRAMEDVIFGGSESRRPLGMAEVSLIFANADGLAPPAYRDYAEIMITRRLYRNGESEYLINKAPCRLLDITELFMDTGVGARAYSVIEQGKIGMILSAKAEDRRFLIEEAAGVTKYKSRKKSALRKIEATRQNLLRLGDIIAEVKRQLAGLKRQAQKAERFRQLREECRNIETHFAFEQYHRQQEALAAAGQQEQSRFLEMEELQADLQGRELRQEELRLQHAIREKDVAGGQERVFHLTSELQKVEGRLDFGARQQQDLQQEEMRLATEGNENAGRAAELDEEELALQASQVALAGELEQEFRQLAEGETHLEDAAERESALATALEEARTELYRILTELSRVGSWHEEIGRRLLSLEERSARNRSEAIGVREQMEEVTALSSTLQGSLGQFRAEHEQLLQEREGLHEALRGLRGKVEEIEHRLLIEREELHRHRSRLDTLRQLEQRLEGYGAGVKLLLSEERFRQLFPRLAADTLDVPADLEKAVEAVLGDRLQALMPAMREDWQAALDYLRGKNGRCTFLLPNFQSPSSHWSDAPGESLLNLLGLGGGSSLPLRNLLAGIFLVPELSPFLHAGLPPGVTLVTKAGEVLTCRGELSGGGEALLDHGVLHKKREIKELSGQIETSATSVEALQHRRQEVKEGAADVEERLREIESAVHQRALKVIDSEKDLLRLQEEAARRQERLEVLLMEEDQLHEERAQLVRQLDDAAVGRHHLQEQKTGHEERVQHLQEEGLVLRRQAEVVRERVTALKVTVASLRERVEGGRRSLERLVRTRQELQGRSASLGDRQAGIAQQKVHLHQEAERLQIELEVLFARREEEKTALERAREKFETIGTDLLTQEEILKTLRGRLNTVREQYATSQLQVRELSLAREHLRETILERYRIDLAEGVPECEDNFDAAGGERRLQELRRLIEEIGEVNLTAIDEYRQLEERYQFLISQQDDLRQSLDGLQTAISKINRTTRKRFRETFDLVNGKFQELFPQLFRGGHAELRLTDEEDLLETGIDIVAQPPGKKLQNVGLLSGGEKALTAIALIFAIFLIKPSPFCFLDEVDAPLDDGNIGRFRDMVRQMSSTSQFIIITHNKRTMEIADTLYGVTMEEPGVSKIVSVRVNDF
jgi:chromosome segregation protein